MERILRNGAHVTSSLTESLDEPECEHKENLEIHIETLEKSQGSSTNDEYKSKMNSLQFRLTKFQENKNENSGNIQEK